MLRLIFLRTSVRTSDDNLVSGKVDRKALSDLNRGIHALEVNVPPLGVGTNGNVSSDRLITMLMAFLMKQVTQRGRNEASTSLAGN